MPLLRYVERMGTPEGNTLAGTDRTVTFGVGGADALSPVSGQHNVLLIGGSGNDTYTVSLPGTAAIIADMGNSSGDRANLLGMFIGDTELAIVDGRHLMAVDTVRDTKALILNWLDPVNRIETLKFADASFTPATLAASIGSNPNYLGGITWEESGFLPAGFGAADMREAITFLAGRERLLDPTSTAGGSGDVGPIVIPAPVNVARSGGTGNDSLNGASGSDTLLGDTGNDTLKGGAGNDFVQGNQGSDAVFGGGGADTVLGGKESDSVRGGFGNDAINGNNSADSVFGDEGDDLVHGGQDADKLFGGAGDDTLYGDLGNDTLAGNLGADVFVFQEGHGADIVADFHSGEDKLQFSAALFASPEAVLTAFSGSVIHDAGGSVTLVGVLAFAAGDVLIA